MNPEETNNTENPQDDKAARMNKFFEEMNMKIEAEEKQIRENPMARATELLKRVFGSLDT